MKDTIEIRYLEYIEKCYRLFINFDEIKVKVVYKVDADIVETDNIKTASEMKQLTERVLQEKIDIQETIKTELKDILSRIEIIAKTGCFSTTLILNKNQSNEYVLEKIMDKLKKNGYGVHLNIHLDKRKVLEVSWG